MNKYINIDYHRVKLSEISEILKELDNDKKRSLLIMRNIVVYAFREEFSPHIRIELVNFEDVNSTITIYVDFPKDFDFKACSIYDYVGKILHVFNEFNFRFILPEFDNILNNNVESNQHPDPMV